MQVQTEKGEKKAEKKKGGKVTMGSRARPSHSCDGWVCDLGAVGATLIFGLVRAAGAFALVLPAFVLVSRIQFSQRYRDFLHRSVFFTT
jgi:hypothetical protein